MRYRWIQVGLALVVATVGRPAAGFGPEDVAELPHFVDEIRATWEVPGVSVAVVVDGTTVFTGGFGTLSLESRAPVTSRTVFGIGSATKAFTALTAATLVDEGRLSWDQPVRTWMPSFQLRDGTATLHASLRDLLLHRTGLPRHDAVWYRAKLSREELIGRMRYLEPVVGFRERFEYSNLPYVVAGYLVGIADGGGWEAAVQERILTPLGMKRTTPGPPTDHDDLALPNVDGPDGKPLAMEPFDGWAIGPALSLYSCAEDMATWLNLQLAPGHPERPALLPDAAMRNLHVPQMVVSTALSRERPLVGYGLGWMVETYRGRLMIWHAGHVDGYYALVAFFPYEDMGVAVLTNRSRNRVPEIVVRWVADRFLGLGEVDWNRRYLAERREIENLERQLQHRVEALRDSSRPPSEPLAVYAGEYHHPAYGDLVIALAGERLTGSFHGIDGSLEPMAGELFLFSFDAPELDDRFLLTFGFGATGGVDTVVIPMEEGVPAVVFRRVVEPEVAAAE